MWHPLATEARGPRPAVSTALHSRATPWASPGRLCLPMARSNCELCPVHGQWGRGHGTWPVVPGPSHRTTPSLLLY